MKFLPYSSNKRCGEHIEFGEHLTFGVLATRFGDRQCFFSFAHLTRAAVLAIWLRRSGLSFSMRPLAPFLPPSLPKATAAGFLRFFVPFGMPNDGMGR